MRKTFITLCILCLCSISSAMSVEDSRLFPMHMNQKMGYVDESGCVVIAPQWIIADSFSYGVAKVSTAPEDEQDSMSDGLINRSGHYILEPDYRIIENEYSYTIGHQEHGEWSYGYFDKRTRYFVAPQYEAIRDSQPFNSDSDLIAVKSGGKWGYLERSTGETIIDFRYDDVLKCFENGYSLMCTNLIEPSVDLALFDRYELIDRQGTTVSFQEKRMPVSGATKGGTVIVIAPSEQEADTRREYLYGLSDITGKDLLPPCYLYIADFSEGLAAFQDTNQLWGVINEEGEVVLPPQYQLYSMGEMPSFYYHEGYAVLRTKDNQWIILDDGGDVVFTRANVDFAISGYAAAKDLFWFATRGPQDTAYGLMRSDGDIITPPIYTSYSSYSEGMCMVKRDGLYGYVNEEGTEIIPCRFSAANDFSNGLAYVGDSTNCCYIDCHGDTVIGL